MAAVTAYVDPTHSSLGSGSISNPYSHLADIRQWGSPDKDGSTILFKRGTVTRDYLGTFNIPNLTIGWYGSDSAKPIVDGSTRFTERWVKEGTLWYAHMPVGYAVAMGNVWTWNVPNKSDLKNNNTNWYDTVNLRLYVSLAEDNDPNESFVYAPTYDHFLDGGANLNGLRIQDLSIRRYRAAGIDISGSFTSMDLIGLESGQHSFDIGSSTQCLSVKGTSAGSKSTGFRLMDFRFYDQRGPSTSHGFETAFLEAPVIQCGTIENCSTQGIEFFRETTNAVIDRVTCRGAGRFWWLADGPSDVGENHSNNIMTNCLNIAEASVWNPQGGRGINQQSGTSNSAYNNVFITDDLPALDQEDHATVGANSFNFKNNVVLQTHETEDDGVFINCDSAVTSDFNCYKAIGGSNERWVTGGTAYGTFAEFQAVSDANSINVDPGFVGYENFEDLKPSSLLSAVVAAGDFNRGVDALIPEHEFTGQARYPFTADRTEIGAYQFERIGRSHSSAISRKTGFRAL